MAKIQVIWSLILEYNEIEFFSILLIEVMYTYVNGVYALISNVEKVYLSQDVSSQVYFY